MSYFTEEANVSRIGDKRSNRRAAVHFRKTKTSAAFCLWIESQRTQYPAAPFPSIFPLYETRETGAAR